MHLERINDGLKPARRAHPGRRHDSFTLIEMLAVIVIISVLAGVLYPAVQTIRQGPKKARARTDMRAIQVAMQNFYNEYGRWPATPANAAEFTAMLNGNRKPYDGSSAAAYASNWNPRAMRFMEITKEQVNSSNELLDPWGNAYMVLLDNGGNAFGNTWIGSWWKDYTPNYTGSASPADGVVEFRELGAYGLTNTVAVYTMGPNGTDDQTASGTDDLCTWK